MSELSGFDAFFATADAGGRQPYPFQVRLAEQAWPETLVIPTGFGKTAAVLAAWLWKRGRGDPDAPRRLVYCLPMRTLVEQTARVAEHWVRAAAEHFGWDEHHRPLIHLAMGGEARPRGAPDWVMQLDRPALIIGTQDMLVSAALMRGFGVSRFRWPVDFALLHQDALWVFDEVQLAGATLPTSAQLQAWRHDPGLFPPMQDAPERPARTLWMSATLDPRWLKTVDFTPVDPLRAHDLHADDLAAAHPAKLWAAKKRLASEGAGASIRTKPGQAAHIDRIVRLTRERLQPGRTVLVFLNTVARAQAAFRALQKADVADVVLLHSRFRPQERAELTRRVTDSRTPPSVIVTTQALEAGVDLTSAALVTEIAPWSSMVQRFGRCNRYAECGEAGADVLWIDLPPGEGAPYAEPELDEARAKLNGLTLCGPEALSRIAPGRPAQSAVIRRRDLLDLFDTEPDLSGFDVDVSLYVRDASDVDVRLFWRDIPAKGAPEGSEAAPPSRHELCPAAMASVRTLMKRKGARLWRTDRLSRRKSVWVPLTPGELRPGLELMVAGDAGGYDPVLGLLADSTSPVGSLLEKDNLEPDAGLDDDLDTEVGAPVSLADHSRHVRDEAQRLCESLGIGGKLRDTLLEAALWHDRGKAHAAFQQMLSPQWRCGDGLLAKSSRRPKPAGEVEADRRRPDPDLRRPRFRHELASMLAYLSERGWAREADLAAYMIAAHHGKVRMRLRALPEEKPADGGRLFARGVWDGDPLPASALAETTAPEATLDLDIMQLGEGEHGASWAARTQALLKTHGPFRLAWLEALVRIADWRASRAEQWAADEPGRDPDTPWGPDMAEGDSA